MSVPLRKNITSQSDVEHVRRAAGALARELDLNVEETEAVVIATAELATNLWRYGFEGHLLLVPITGPEGTNRSGIEIQSCDRGPGIADVDLALQDGFSTGGGFGNGLPALCRLMDDVVIETAPTGTYIVARKWASR